MSVPGAQLKVLTAISKPDCVHIAERHGPGGSSDALFDQNFLDANGGYGGIAKSVFETGDSSVEYDNSRRLIYRYYKNFNTKTGIGKDKDGRNVVFKGVEMVGTLGTFVFNVETMFPKGILKT